MRIGILGASSQVGSSLAYYLNKDPQVEVVCFVRSLYSGIYFDLLNIPICDIDLNNLDKLRNDLKDFDAIVDCTYPKGQLYNIKKIAIENVDKIVSCMPKGSIFFYMSSIMAYGMGSDEIVLKDYLIPKTSYALIKRKIEKAVEQTGEKFGVKVFNFRLSQVHGFLQSVDASFREKLSAKHNVILNGNPEDLTNTIFPSSIAEGILTCIVNQKSPGTYTLVSTPQWTLKELYEYYKNKYNLTTELVYAPSAKAKSSFFLKKWIINFLKKNRSYIETYFIMKFPSIFIKAKGKFRKGEVSNEVSQRNRLSYVDVNILGKPPKQILEVSNSSVGIVKLLEEKFQEEYFSKIFSNRL